MTLTATIDFSLRADFGHALPRPRSCKSGSSQTPVADVRLRQSGNGLRAQHLPILFGSRHVTAGLDGYGVRFALPARRHLSTGAKTVSTHTKPEDLLAPFEARAAARPVMEHDVDAIRADHASCGLVIDGPTHVYNEDAFRFFLDVERRRSLASNRPFLVVLLDLKPEETADSFGGWSEKVFSSLRQGIRETDFMGWYRAGSTIGAVLVQHAPGGLETRVAVAGRITRFLNERLPIDLARRTKVRVYLGTTFARQTN
jgi:hypothetical protein